jgi:hypothetical protein
MTETKSSDKFSKFFRNYLPSEINIDKNEIFYRDKYNEIINYIKIILSNSEDLEILRYLKPKGTLLIHLNYGTDIIDLFKIISSNYFLEYIELNYAEILKNPEEFYHSFEDIIKNVIEFGIKKSVENEKDRKNDKKLILIDQKPNLKSLLNDKSLLIKLLENVKNRDNDLDLIKNGIVLVWLTYEDEDVKENSHELFNIFDLFINIPLLRKEERETFLKGFLEKNNKISFDVNTVLNYTNNWELSDIKQLLKTGIFKHYINSDLNEVSNEISDTLINIIELGEIILSNQIKLQENHPMVNDIQNVSNINKEPIPLKKISQESMNYKDNYINEMKEQGISEFMLNQLYENAASHNYNELIIIIDKLNKKEPLEDFDRKFLAKYPFILNENPNIAQINLEKAKKRIDLIKRAFAK